MIIDLINDHIAVPDFSILTGGLQGPDHPSFTYIGEPDSNGMRDLVYMKSKSGFPYDWLRIGEKYAYQLYTENKNWNNPQMLKAVMGNGARRFPRFIDWSPDQSCPGIWGFDVSQPESDYLIFSGGDYTTGGISKNTNRYCRCSVLGPFPGSTIDDIPEGEEWRLVFQRGGYQLGGPFPVTETIFCRRNYGRIGWQQVDASGTQSHFTTHIIPGPIPKPVMQLFAIAQ